MSSLARSGIVRLSCLWLVAAVSSLLGQGQSRLTGTITDASNALIPGAEVTLRNVATAIIHTAQANATGTYNFPYLPPGEYALSCTAAGFKTHTQTGIVLETGFARTLDIKLALGPVAEIIEVTSKAPLLESENATVGQLIEQASVINMPLESRRAGSLVRLLGNVAFTDETFGENLVNFSMSGGRARNQMWLLDGGIIQNVAMGTPQISLNPPSESLQEFKVESNNYSAEHGRAGGGLILMTTKSGTNDFHGNAYEYLRNDKLDARTFFDQSKAPLRYNIFGATLGGPIRRNRAFFFANYEGARRGDGVTVSGQIVPRSAEKAGDFSARTDRQIIDPVTKTPFPRNIIPPSRIDPLAAKFVALYPDPNQPGNLAVAPKSNYNANVVDTLAQTNYTTRVDFKATDSNQFYGRYSYTESPRTNAGSWAPNAFADSRAQTQNNWVHNGMGNWFHHFGPTLIQETRYLYSRRGGNPLGAGTGTGLNGKFGLRGVNEEALARVTVTGLSTIGQTQHGRNHFPQITQQFDYALTKIRGNHQIKGGFQYRYTNDTDDQNAATGGRFNFTNRATGEGLATLLLGWVSTASIIDTLPLVNRSDFHGVFVQDDWKLTPKLSLNLGVRWEVDTPRWEAADNRQNGFAMAPINPVSGTPGIVTFAGRDGRSRYAHDFDWNNVGPRFGFAWRARPKTTVRGGYGLYYLGAYRNNVNNSASLGFSINQNFNSPDGGLTPAFLFKDGMPAAPQGEALGPAFGAVKVGESPRTAPDFFQQDHVNGYMQQWNLTVQHDVGFNSIVEVGYLANVGHKLGGPNVSLNMVPLDQNGMGPARQNQTLRPFPQFSDVILDSPPWGNSTYHALNVKWDKRYSNGVNFLVNYTWSKFIDDVEANSEIAGGDGNGYTHIARRKFDKSLAGNDIRNRVIASADWDLPWGDGRKFPLQHRALRTVAGGWGLSTIVELRNGSPFGVVEQTEYSNTFAGSVRPNILRSPTLDSGRARGAYVEQWFDTSAFVDPGARHFGNAARTYCCAPGLALVDAAVHKTFSLTERVRLLFRSDFYNLLNRPHFAAPNATRGNADFGRINAILLGSYPRRIQFSLKLQF